MFYMNVKFKLDSMKFDLLEQCLYKNDISD